MKKPYNRIKTQLHAEENLGQLLMKTIGSSAGIKLAFTGLGLLNTILLAKILGPSHLGIYSFAMALVGFLSIPSQFGIPTLATREIAIFNTRKDWPHMRGFIKRSHQAIGLFSLVLVFIALITLSIFDMDIEKTKLDTIMASLLLVPILSLSALRAGMLKGLRYIILGSIPEEVVRPTVFLIMLAGVFFLYPHSTTASQIMALQIAASLTAFCVGLYFFLKHKPSPLKHTKSEYNTSIWLKSSIPLGLTASLHFINGQTDILVLGLFNTDADVGIYRIALQMAILIAFGLFVLNSIQAPHIAHLHSINDKIQLQEMITKTAWWNLAFTIPVVLALFLFGESLIQIAFGDEFIPAYTPLLILCIGQIVNVVMGPVDWLLNMTGYERDTTTGIAIAAVVNLILNFLLIPSFGMNGAAIATSVTLIVWKLALWKKVYHRIGIEASVIIKHKY